MSMTLEEAIKLLKQYQGYEPMFPDGETLKHAFDLTDETVDTLLTALRPVSRERVEKVLRGEWVDKGWDGDFSWKIDGRGNCWKVIECSQCQCKVSAQTNFCPNCGAPMTDEAVDIMVTRLEATRSGKERLP